MTRALASAHAHAIPLMQTADDGHSVRQFQRRAALVCALLLGGAGNGTSTAQPFTIFTSSGLLSMQPCRFVELLATGRPVPVSAADKRRILRTLPKEGEA